MKKPLLYKFFLGITLLTSSCGNLSEERYTDDKGNIFIKKGENISIIPAQYETKGKTYKIFIYNETESEIGVLENIKIRPNEFIVVSLVDTATLKIDNGVEFKFGDTYGLEIIDEERQVSGSGGEYLKKYNVPDEAEWAFVIVPKGEGD